MRPNARTSFNSIDQIDAAIRMNMHDSEYDATEDEFASGVAVEHVPLGTIIAKANVVH